MAMPSSIARDGFCRILFVLPMATQLLLEAIRATQVTGATQRAVLNALVTVRP